MKVKLPRTLGGYASTPDDIPLQTGQKVKLTTKGSGMDPIEVGDIGEYRSDIKSVY